MYVCIYVVGGRYNQFIRCPFFLRFAVSIHFLSYLVSFSIAALIDIMTILKLYWLHCQI